jgi:hypothetical protein
MKLINACIAATACLTLASCAQPTLWVKPGASQADYNTDSYSCEKDARQSGYFGNGIPGAVNFRDFMNRCMFAHGWSIQGSPNVTAQMNTQEPPQQTPDEYKATLLKMNSDCKKELEIKDLDAIRDKVELLKSASDGPTPFEILSNKNYPSTKEKAAISLWAKMRDSCNKRIADYKETIPLSNGSTKESRMMQNSILNSALAKISSLSVQLYDGKLTYGEFAKQRMDAINDSMDAQREWMKTIAASKRASSTQ